MSRRSLIATPPRTGTEVTDREAHERSKVAREVNDLRAIPFLTAPGCALRVVLTAFVNKTVRHGLGRPAAFMIIRHSTGTGVLYEVTSTTIDALNEIVIGCDANGTFDLWFYPRLTLQEV